MDWMRSLALSWSVKSKWYTINQGPPAGQGVQAGREQTRRRKLLTLGDNGEGPVPPALLGAGGRHPAFQPPEARVAYRWSGKDLRRGADRMAAESLSLL